MFRYVEITPSAHFQKLKNFVITQNTIILFNAYACNSSLIPYIAMILVLIVYARSIYACCISTCEFGCARAYVAQHKHRNHWLNRNPRGCSITTEQLLHTHPYSAHRLHCVMCRNKAHTALAKSMPKHRTFCSSHSNQRARLAKRPTTPSRRKRCAIHGAHSSVARGDRAGVHVLFS